MKMRNTKKTATRVAYRQTAKTETINLPRLFLFLELFVDKDIPGRSTK